LRERSLIVAEIVLISLIGGFISIDRTAAFQIMISRPVVTSPLIGMMLGDVMTGIQAGLIIELLWIGALPVGASVPPDETIVSILVPSLAIWQSRIIGGESFQTLAFALVLTIPLAMLARRLDSRIREKNIASAHAADRFVQEGSMEGVGRECLSGLKRFYFAYSLLIFISLITGAALFPFLYSLLPPFFLKGLERLFYLLPVIGLASLMVSTRVKNSLKFFFLSFTLVFSLFEVF